ncbi:O-antigen ligase family protein [Candidatus Gottesmanbacteria bacterium]|nr:O-antigen ligase family protein [Candidatus Gottesmanbacteria bacterium]
MAPLHRLFFYTTIILLPTQLGLHFWPQWALVLGRRVDYLSPTLYLTDILILLTIAFWFIGNLKRITNYDLRITREKIINRKSLFLILLISFVFINILFSNNKPIAIFHWLKVFEFILLGYYIIKTKPSFSQITAFLSIAIAYSSVIAIIQFFLQHSIGGPLWVLGERTFTVDTPGIARMEDCRWRDISSCMLLLRPYGTFPHPNVLGGFLAVTLPLLLTGLSSPINKKLKKIPQWIMKISLLIGLIALALTFSRSAWLVGTSGIGVSIWLTGRSLKKIKQNISNFILMPGFPLPLVLVLLLVGIVIFIAKSFSLNDESIVVRQELNTAAIRMWQRSPVFGVGLGNFLVTLPQMLPSRTVYFLQPVHNIYLLILSEAGIVGLIFFLRLIVFIIKIYDLRFTIYDQKQITPKFIIRNSVFLILLLGLVDHYPLTLQQGQLLLTIFLSLSLLKPKFD